MPDTLLKVENLKKTYESSTGIVEAIGDISFAMHQGELVCIVGPSGCGKTTLLKCVAGLLRPTAGVIELDGQPVTDPPENMALVFQEYGRSLYPWLTVRGNVELPLPHKKLSKLPEGSAPSALPTCVPFCSALAPVANEASAS